MKYFWYFVFFICNLVQFAIHTFSSQLSSANAVLQLNDSSFDYAVGIYTSGYIDILSLILLVLTVFSVYKIIILWDKKHENNEQN